MAQSYKLEVLAPSSAVASARTWEFTPATGNCVSVDVELKKDQKRISVLQSTIYDPRFEIFNALPDPAFASVPVNFYMSTPDQPSTPSQLVFAGKITSLQLGYPAFDKFTLVAHDNSIDARKKQSYRTLKGQTSTGVLQQIAKSYNLSVDLSAVVQTLKPRAVEFGPELSDWDLLGRALAYDGLEVFMKGSTVVVRPAPTQTYGTIFQKDTPPVIRLDVMINHVGSGGPDKRGAVALENSGTQVGASADLAEVNKENATIRTHRRPVGGTDATVTGSHSEAPGNAGWTNQVTQIRRRKDTASLECTALPDLGLQHKAKLQGWGGKVDGEWFINMIKHVVVGSDFASTHVEMQRAPSSGAALAAGVPFAQ